MEKRKKELSKEKKMRKKGKKKEEEHNGKWIEELTKKNVWWTKGVAVFGASLQKFSRNDSYSLILPNFGLLFSRGLATL